MGIKVFVLISSICAIGALFARGKGFLLGLGIVGLGCLLAGYLILRQNSSGLLEMKMGGYFSIIGFLLILGDAFLPGKPKVVDEGDLQ